MPFQLGLPAALAREGLRVELSPGWATRGSSSFNPRGSVSHWTAGSPSGDRGSLGICTHGRLGLAGPLCNVFLTRGGVAIVVAAGRANHAGVGGWRGLAGNSSVFGTEAESTGKGWTAAQRDAYPRVNAAFCRLGGFDAAMCCGHSEWAGPRKSDINDWPMSAMRTQVAAILRGGPTPTPTARSFLMSLSDAEEREVLDRLRAVAGDVWGHKIDYNQVAGQPAYALLAATQIAAFDTRVLAGTPDSGSQAVDVDALAAALASRLQATDLTALAERLQVVVRP